ncbi:transport ATPase [Streptomyces spinoverrucosus]|uniref:Probable cation-transporting ATPase I n=1 Tax=Streptomyces spinoverrucosus TaxID=284043 RepID=A0A4Y3VDY3_9ACTN|nr:cation-translocating P-type ATPase [Streptomyces spinoverrucosus]GEC05084.1 transport ATPase [Streptomyces spinoverrucosus]GHB71793.1 transport ATPase [Streptomyces spinoverrucosus]
MGLWLLTGSSAAVSDIVMAGPRLLVRGTAPAVGAAAGAVAGTARAGVRGAEAMVRVSRVARGALPGGGRHWRAGRRVHLALRAATEPERADQAERAGATARAARRMAEALAEHPDVAYAYWDGGLARLVVAATETALTDRVLERANELADRHGLTPADDAVEEFAHPGDPAAVRTVSAAIVADAAGIVAAVTGSMMRLPPSPRFVTAGVTLLRENPRFRGWLRSRFGASRTDLILAVANAAAHGAGQTPTSLVLDGALRSLQLAEAVARAAAFDSVHDQVCRPGRDDVAAHRFPRPPLRTAPAQAYAVHAETGSVVGAAVTLLVKHSGAEAAEAVLAGSPKAARYGPAAFHAVLGCALARTGVLVRNMDRLRQLETARTVFLHPSALHSADGSADPWAEAVLDAARRAGLRVVVVADPALGEFTALADHIVPADRAPHEVVDRLRGRGGVITVARPSSSDDTGVLSGLLAGDVAVALADGDAAVAWGADLVAPGGLADVWRLLRAVPVARRVGRRSQVLARSGAALSGLLVAVGEAKGGARMPLIGLRHAPVDIGATLALLGGARSAVGVAAARAPHPRPRVPWHALKVSDVQKRLARRAEEPATAVAAATGRVRKAAGTVVRAPGMEPVRWTLQLGRAVRGELDDPLTPVLAVGSAASAILGSVVDALLVVGALDLNALVGGVQRLRAERALSGLVAEQKQKARVTNGDAMGARTVDATRLHPGDVIELKADDVVPADARLLWEDGLEVDESALTGESLPVDKQTEPTPQAAVADRRCMVFEGTTVVAGQARAVVVETGERTEAARAVHLAARKPPAAGVQARLQELTGKALPLTMAGGAAVTGLSLLRGAPIREAVSGGVAVAVAAVPEGLPLVATVAQLAAARRLSHRGVLVRAPRTLEALGRMDTVCFDKTGTLTENKLRLVRVTHADGTARTPQEAADTETMLVAVRACPQPEEGPDKPVHATDEAVLTAAGRDPAWVQTEGRPFEAGRGYAGAVGHAGDGKRVLVVKGAPETVLPACRDVPDDAYDQAHDLARDGLRVLAVAQRPLADGEKDAEVCEEPPKGLEFTGLLALADVPRESSTALVRGLREAGVRPVMLTGDHPQTARAIAVQLGWPEDTDVVTGDELAAADRSERARMLHDVGVVARVAPEQKLQVIEALMDSGRVVGMVGDGANDAAAIRAADIGVGISARGSAAARNAADLVLTNGDMTVLVEAVSEGRALWHSVADAVAILIGGNAGEVGFGIVGSLLGGTAPLSTRQMLLVNLFTDLFPAMAVAVTPQKDVREEASAGSGPLGTTLLGTPLMRQIRHRALTTCLGAVAAWLIGRFTPGSARRTTTMALCAVVGTQLAQTLADRRESPLVRVTVLGSAVALVALVETPGVSQALGCIPLGPIAWGGVLAAIALAVTGQRALPHIERAVVRLGQ